MKCRLCDRPTAGGSGRLCADCGKALQRARGAALNKLPPAVAVVAEPARARPITLTVTPPATAPRSSRAIFWLAAIGLVAITLVYVVQRELATSSGPATPGTSRSPAGMTERVNVEPSPVVTRVEEPSWTAIGEAEKSSSVADGSATSTSATAAKAPVGSNGKAGAKQAKGAAQDPKSMPPPLPAEYDMAAPKPAETAPQPQLAGAKVAVPSQPVDEAQVLASAMQKCGSEGGFSKFICEQKTFYAYCEDKWDKDPRCMRKTADR